MTLCGAASVGTLEIIGGAVPGAGWATLTMKRPAGAGVIAGPGPSGLSVAPAGRRRVVMEPQDPGAGWAAGGGHLRASDAERELVIDALKAAFVQGRLGRSELARRAGQALESRTYAELAGATAGIAAGRAAAAPARRAGARHTGQREGHRLGRERDHRVARTGRRFLRHLLGQLLHPSFARLRRGGRDRHAWSAVSSPPQRVLSSRSSRHPRRPPQPRDCSAAIDDLAARPAG
jgi:hypothetical protein